LRSARRCRADEAAARATAQWPDHQTVAGWPSPGVKFFVICPVAPSLPAYRRSQFRCGLDSVANPGGLSNFAKSACLADSGCPLPQALPQSRRTSRLDLAPSRFGATGGDCGLRPWLSPRAFRAASAAFVRSLRGRDGPATRRCSRNRDPSCGDDFAEHPTLFVVDGMPRGAVAGISDPGKVFIVATIHSRMFSRP
jgi:hypothetical protein